MATTYSMQVRRESVLSGRNIGATESIAAGASGGFNEDVPTGTSDLRVNCAVDVSAVKAFSILSDRNVRLETNSGSAPADTIELIAGKVYDFADGDYNPFLLGTDVVAFFLTNVSGETANVACQFVYDPSPSSASSSPSASPSASVSASPSTSPSASVSSSPSASTSNSPSTSPSSSPSAT